MVSHKDQLANDGSIRLVPVANSEDGSSCLHGARDALGSGGSGSHGD